MLQASTERCFELVNERGVQARAAWRREENELWLWLVLAVSPKAHGVSVGPNTPGPKASGTLYILGPDDTASATVHSPDTPTYDIRPGTRMLGRAKAHIQVGTLLVPRLGEGAKLAELGDPRLVEALRAMGYIE